MSSRRGVLRRGVALAAGMAAWPWADCFAGRAESRGRFQLAADFGALPFDRLE